ncbi:MAG: PEP-utilizing enzyme [Actinomycetota bacterium]
MWPWQPVGGGRWVGSDSSDRFPIYTRGNAGEVYPEVFRPLSFSIANLAGERAMRNAVLRSGFVREDEIADVPITVGLGSGVFGGYAYLNLSMNRLGAARVPGGSATDADRSYLGVGDPPPHVPLPNEKNLRATIAGMRTVWRMSGHTSLPEIDTDRRDIDAYLAGLPDPAAASDAELRASTSDDLIERFGRWFETHLVVSFGAGTLMAVLTQICEKQLGDESIAIRLVSGLGDVDSAAPASAMWGLGRIVADSPALTAEFDQGVDGLFERVRELGERTDDSSVTSFVAAFDDLLERHGARGANEWDTAFDTWGTDPELALALVDRMRLTDPSHAPDVQRDRLAAEREQLEAETLERLGRPARRLFRRVLRSTRMYLRGRERAKTNVVEAIHGARLRAQELDRRLVARSGGERGDLWFLLIEELDDYVADPAAFRETIGERREMLARLEERIPPFFFEGEQPPLEEWELRSDAAANASRVEPGDVIAGLAGCVGVARGRARVVTDPGDPRGLEPGDVLVAPHTDPSWTPLFVPADAVVVDVGATMSHAVIVSRELGIPCVVSATDATRRIPDGATIEVDGTAGTVTVIDVP